MLVRASDEENPDLLWAHRGGGGNFGVVTALELGLHPVGPEVYGGVLMFPAERGREVLRRWRDVMHAAPEELSLAFAYITGPADDPDVPAELRGRLTAIVAGMHAGSIADGERALRPLRALGPAALDAFGPVPYADFQCSIDDPPGYRNYWTAEQLPDLPDDVIDLIHARALEMPGSAPQIFGVAWGGAVARNDTGPLAGRDSRSSCIPSCSGTIPLTTPAWWRGAAPSAMRSVNTPRASPISTSPATKAPRASGPSTARAAAERIARIKAEWDAENVFRAVGNVPAA